MSLDVLFDVLVLRLYTYANVSVMLYAEKEGEWMRTMAAESKQHGSRKVSRACSNPRKKFTSNSN